MICIGLIKQDVQKYRSSITKSNLSVAKATLQSQKSICLSVSKTPIPPSSFNLHFATFKLFSLF